MEPPHAEPEPKRTRKTQILPIEIGKKSAFKQFQFLSQT